MSDPLFTHLKLVEQLSRLTEPYRQLAKIAEPYRFDRVMREVHGPAWSFSSSGLMDVQRALAGVSAYGANWQKVVSMIPTMPTAPHVDYTWGLAAAIERISSVTKLVANPSMLRVTEIAKSMRTVDSTVGRQLTAIFGATDYLRLAKTVADVHKTIWPHDAVVLRMLDSSSFGMASWFKEERARAEPVVPRRFDLELAAIVGNQKHDDAEPINITTDVHCFICKEPMLDPDTQVSWVGPRSVELSSPVVPFCKECSARDAEAPGYIAVRVRELLQQPEPENRPQRLRLEVLLGEETDPVPRGELKLVEDEPDEEGEP